jgi:hypothetical protein
VLPLAVSRIANPILFRLPACDHFEAVYVPAVCSLSGLCAVFVCSVAFRRGWVMVSLREREREGRVALGSRERERESMALCARGKEEDRCCVRSREEWRYVFFGPHFGKAS